MKTTTWSEHETEQEGDMEKAIDTTTHVFEQAGLGRAPFRFVGFEDTASGADQNGMVRRSVGGLETITKPGGSCDYCGNYITQYCWIKSKDGKRFKVGTSCVEKAGDKGLFNKAKRVAGKVRRAKAKVREEARIEAAIAAFVAEGSEVRAWLEQFPSPHAYRASQGDTWADTVEWNLVKGFEAIDGSPIPGAGHSGQLKMARLIERIQKGRQEAPSWATEARA